MGLGAAAGTGRFAVITDPGSALGDLARERGFAEVFENRSDIGGRYSALSLFGVVPALLMGADADALLAGGLTRWPQRPGRRRRATTRRCGIAVAIGGRGAGRARQG